MSDGENVWIEWVCEAFAVGCERIDIIEEIRDQGHPDPQRFVEEISASPIFKWGLAQRKKNRPFEIYKRLHTLLDQRAEPRLCELEFPKDQHLFDLFYQTNQPFILKGWADRWHAFLQPWSADRFLEEFPSVPIEVTMGRESREDFDLKAHLLKEKTTLGELATRVLQCESSTNDFYLIARNHALDQPELMSLFEEIDERPILNPDQRRRHAALWFGPKGTYTPLHHDTCNIMFVQMWGEKRIDLLPPHRFDLFEHSMNMYASLDLRIAQQAEQRTVTLKAGEALFIPVGWWHQVEALTHSTSLAMTHFYQNNQYQWYQPGQ
jgi:hypothetical protein